MAKLVIMQGLPLDPMLKVYVFDTQTLIRL